MYTQAHKHVDECKICNKAGSIQRNNDFNHIISHEKGELVEIDLIGPLPITGNGNKFIITAIDNYSKYAMAQAIPAKTPYYVIQFLNNILLKNFPNIQTILSDNGLEFKAFNVQQFASAHNFTWNFGAPYHPQTQGAIERFNGTIQNKLKKLTDFGRLKWDRYVEPAIFAYNRSFHRVLGASPTEFLHGEIPSFEIDKVLLPEDFSYKINTNHLKTLKNTIENKYGFEFKGSTRIKHEFTVGDPVLYYRSTSQKSKLDTPWEDGYVIVEPRPMKESYIIKKGLSQIVASKIFLKLDRSS